MDKSFEVNLIVAMSKNRCIGKDNNLIYHIKEDLKRFKELTTNNVIIMGSNTFKSLPKGALPNRINIVVTNDEALQKSNKADNLIFVNSVEDALKLYKSWFYHDKGIKECKKVFIIGGGLIYRYALDNNLVDKIYLTVVNEDADGDTFFPKLDDSWKLISEEKMDIDNKEVVFDVLEKIENDPVAQR